jgi:hypothetical protein
MDDLIGLVSLAHAPTPAYHAALAYEFTPKANFAGG